MVCVLKWWFYFVVSLFAMAALAVTGNLTKLWTADIYKAVFITLTAYFFASAWIGRLTYREARGYSDYFVYKRHVEFMPDLMTQLGLIGTVIGFVLMLGGFVVSTDPATMQKATGVMIQGATIALYNTAVGLICSLLVKAQTLNLVLVAGDGDGK